MEFLSFESKGRQHIGVLASDGKIVELTGVGAQNMLELIEQGDEALEFARSALDGSAPRHDAADINILAPIPRPRKNIFAVGLNYVKHNAEFTGSDKLPENPIIFTKAPTSVIAPEEGIELHSKLTTSLDYEVELGVVIGKRGRDIPKEQAEDYIFGYTIINDVTARDLQKRTSQWFLGKSLDTTCPMGPYLVHKSAVGWPVRLDISTKVNGELRQNSNTEHLYFDIPTLIATISAGLTLEPGDIIATGTPEGVGMGFSPPRFLKSGDRLELTIEKLGTLVNSVVG